MPLVHDPQVAGRFGDPNYIPLHRLDDEDTETFMTALLEEWIDPARRGRDPCGYGSVEANGEPVTDKTFPFTVPGPELTVQYACRQGGYTTPRDIQVTLGRAAESGDRRREAPRLGRRTLAPWSVADLADGAPSGGSTADRQSSSSGSGSGRADRHRRHLARGIGGDCDRAGSRKSGSQPAKSK